MICSPSTAAIEWKPTEVVCCWEMRRREGRREEKREEERKRGKEREEQGACPKATSKGNNRRLEGSVGSEEAKIHSLFSGFWSLRRVYQFSLTCFFFTFSELFIPSNEELCVYRTSPPSISTVKTRIKKEKENQIILISLYLEVDRHKKKLNVWCVLELVWFVLFLVATVSFHLPSSSLWVRTMFYLSLPYLLLQKYTLWFPARIFSKSIRLLEVRRNNWMNEMISWEFTRKKSADHLSLVESKSNWRRVKTWKSGDLLWVSCCYKSKVEIKNRQPSSSEFVWMILFCQYKYIINHYHRFQ